MNQQINQSIEIANKSKLALKKSEGFKCLMRKNKDLNLSLIIKNITNNDKRSRSKPNLDQTNTTLTKTSSDPATTTSKRLLNDHMLKTSAHKIYIDNFKNNIMKNLSSSLIAQLQKRQHNAKENPVPLNYLNIQTEVNEGTHIPSHYTNTEILKTIASSVIEELEPITMDFQQPIIDLNLRNKEENIHKDNKSTSNNNQPSSGTLISEESPFNRKLQSNSNTRNNSFSFKQLSNKQSSNSSINPTEKKCNIILFIK